MSSSGGGWDGIVFVIFISLLLRINIHRTNSISINRSKFDKIAAKTFILLFIFIIIP